MQEESRRKQGENKEETGRKYSLPIEAVLTKYL
jgi:hypothetical protein